MASTLLTPVGRTDRVGRYPKHPHLVESQPYVLQPFMFAPVLPGESLTNLYMEARVVSDPVLNKLIGWKKEYYYFYVRITDLLTDAIRDMFVDPTNTDLTATLGIAANDQQFYTAKGGIDYLKRCLQMVTKHYFRDEDEPWNSQVAASGLPIVQIKENMWMDSLTDKDLMPEGPNIAAATTAGDLDRLMDAFEQLRALGIANMSYEDFLRSYGISIPEKDENKPEMLCRFTDFQYPSNTINPANGAPTSALSWVFKNGNRDPKFFKEPGFLIGCTVTRPKVYYAGLAGNLASFMGRAWDWMPSYLTAMPETSLKRFVGDTGPLGDRTTAPDHYWVDMRDLLLYGDQFHNVQAFPAVPATVGANHMVPLPTGDTFNSRYIPSADLGAFFVTPATGRVREDGYTSLSIKGAQVDRTVGNLANL